MVYRNNEYDPPSKQEHSLVVMLGTFFFVVMCIVLFSALFSGLDMWWKIGIILMSIYILYGIGVMIKKALIGKDYCTECGRQFET